MDAMGIIVQHITINATRGHHRASSNIAPHPRIADNGCTSLRRASQATDAGRQPRPARRRALHGVARSVAQSES